MASFCDLLEQLVAGNETAGDEPQSYGLENMTLDEIKDTDPFRLVCVWLILENLHIFIFFIMIFLFGNYLCQGWPDQRGEWWKWR